MLISRVSTVVVLILCGLLAWALQKVNIALIVFIGIGGMSAAFAGPLVVGALWKGVTKSGAYAGLISGFTIFVILHAGWIDPAWFGSSGVLFDIATWLKGEGPNPFSCSAMGEIVGVIVTYTVSKLTKPLPDTVINDIFRPETAEEAATQ